MIDIDQLRDICCRDFSRFEAFGQHYPTPDCGGYYFDNRSEPVLGVAHLDTVLPPLGFECQGEVVRCPTLDDRLGAYLLLHLLPSLGVEFDLLLTDGEEQGRSTARHFQPPRPYHWVFQFDRKGTDVVLYQYDAAECRGMLQDCGFVVGRGTRSDISVMEHLHVKCFNFGCGYHQPHTSQCYAYLDETEEMVRRFVRFWQIWKDVPLPHP